MINPWFASYSEIGLLCFLASWPLKNLSEIFNLSQLSEDPSQLDKVPTHHLPNRSPAKPGWTTYICFNQLMWWKHCFYFEQVDYIGQILSILWAIYKTDVRFLQQKLDITPRCLVQFPPGALHKACCPCKHIHLKVVTGFLYLVKWLDLGKVQ